MNFRQIPYRQLLILFLVSIFFFASFVLAQTRKPPVYVARATEYDVSMLPVLKKYDSIPVLSAQGVYAYDVASGVVLYEKNPDLQLYPASTTKIVTALVALDNYDLDETVNTGVFTVEGSKMGLSWNEEITARDLLYGLLVYSGNDAAEVLANNIPGGREEFVMQMNFKAQELHAQSSRFANPSGLDQANQVTTARDLARIASQAMLNKTFAEIVATEEYVAENIDGTLLHKLENRNELLGKVAGVMGVKTGWTEEARENLVTYVERDGKVIMLALLGSQDRFSETEELVEWIFENYEWKNLNYYSDETAP